MKFFAESANALAGWSGFLEPVAWKGFVILALVFAMMTLWRRSAAAVRHLVWTMTFLCLLCLPVFVQRLPAWRAPVWIVSSGLNNSLPDSLSFILQNKIRPESKLSLAVSESAPDAHHLTDASRKTAHVEYAIKWSDIAVVVWFAGAMIGLARLLAIQIRLERMAGRMRACENREHLKWIEDLQIEYRIRRPVKLLISETSASPMTWGFGKPVIALPADSLQWSDERLRVVLRHELAHVKRWDCLTQEIAYVVCALYWFNPLTWLAAGRMRAEREKACDDFVLNCGARPSEYAGHLVEIAWQFASANLQGAVAMARPTGLEQRVTAILDGRRNRNRIAKTTAALIVLAILGLETLIGGCSNKNSPGKWSLNHSEVSAQLKSFVAEKEEQANAVAKAEGKEMPSEFKAFFAAAAKGDDQTVTNSFNDMRKRAPEDAGGHDENLRGPMWTIVIETAGTFEQFARSDDKYSIAFGNDIIQSIPNGSIYFGGTDPGRFLVTSLQKSHVDGDPFFTLTQNALTDNSYLDYLQSMYGDKIVIPTKEDSQKCFKDYFADAKQRQQNHQLEAGENISVDSNGNIQVSGQVGVMTINGLIAKVIFDKNPNREFYIEESFPLDWMYPYLEPHGLILKINRQPLPELSDEIVQRDHDYWTKYVQPMIGDWLNTDTSVEEVTAFAEKVYVKKDFNGFTGDSSFVQNDYSCKMFSKERANIADLYVWRMNHAATSDEKERMAREADFAFRQALALCPYNPEAVKDYADFLKSQNRDSDAVLVNEMAKQFSKPK